MRPHRVRSSRLVNPSARYRREDIDPQPGRSPRSPGPSWPVPSRAEVSATRRVAPDRRGGSAKAGLDQLRSIFDAGAVRLVLIGVPGLERRLARYAHLCSRIGFVQKFRMLAVQEVRTLLVN